MSGVAVIRLSGLTALLFALGGPAGARAQVRFISTGETVRLQIRGQAEAVEGTVDLSPGSLSLTDARGTTRTFDPADVARVEVRGTRGNTLKGTLIGGGVGLAFALVMIATTDADCAQDFTGICDAVGDTFEVWGIVWGTVLGAGAGALVGTLIKTSRWVPAVVPPTAPGGGDFGLVWSVPLGGWGSPGGPATAR